MNFDSDKERFAWEFAKVAHKDQRYNAGMDPYTVHLYAVHKIVKENELSEDVRVAALLHDILEDTTTTYLELEKYFDKPVAGLVEAVTGRGATRKARNENAYQKIIAAGKDAAFLKLCDRIANVEASRVFRFGETRDLYHLYRKEQTSLRDMLLQALENGVTTHGERNRFAQMMRRLEGALS